MKNLFTIIALGYACALVMGCSNESLWQSLKAQDAILHPATESKKTSDKPDSYQNYERERDALLNNDAKK